MTCDPRRIRPARVVFNQLPLFSVWAGYEGTNGPVADLVRNFEEISAFDVNPHNGDIYQLAFDSVPANQVRGAVDDVGDTFGDYDLYRFNFSTIFNDFVANARPRGVMYTDTIAPDGFNYATTYGAGRPAVDNSNVGVPNGRSNLDNGGVADANDIIFLDGAVEKIGEVARVQNTPFFGRTPTNASGDQQAGQDLQFVDADTLLLFETTNNFDLDYQVRVIQRQGLTPGTGSEESDVTATTDPDDFAGGYNPKASGFYASAPAGTALASERWHSVTLDTDPTAANSGGLFVKVDGPGVTEVDGMRYVERNGIAGVWVTDRLGSDDFTFYQLDLNAYTATPRELLPEPDTTNPATAPVAKLPLSETASNVLAADGELDWFDVDENGQLVIAESGFSNTPQAEPKIILKPVSNYNAPDTNGNLIGEIDLGAGQVLANITTAVDDDAAVTDGRFGLFDRGNNYVYYFDLDTGNSADAYVYDIDTQTVVYSETNAIPHFLDDANLIRVFTYGDFANRDGVVNAADIDALYARIADPTAGGRYTAAVGQEMFDITGDNLLSGTPGSGGDVDRLVRQILRTQYGDTNLNGNVNDSDFSILVSNFGASGGWAAGSFNGVGLVDDSDFSLLVSNFGFLQASGQSASGSASVAGSQSSGGATAEPSKLSKKEARALKRAEKAAKLKLKKALKAQAAEPKLIESAITSPIQA